MMGPEGFYCSASRAKKCARDMCPRARYREESDAFRFKLTTLVHVTFFLHVFSMRLYNLFSVELCNFFFFLVYKCISIKFGIRVHYVLINYTRRIKLDFTRNNENFFISFLSIPKLTDIALRLKINKICVCKKLNRNFSL